ncbi:hypothetical protein M409DRAFT_29515 [Zasmidium cellare ATCC 36951]|uniref:Glycosyltransferase family 8 protein n=1 Tax=Zasmidium cellare ATCC 36951 TaxID=1080233 RepID=A0A6A6C1C7_ZASCE|nr:uncharacterized protein M409DRAFT_29515 [Zasmidium cellare ATCC 36951]KAF2160068.1 hypothetical protein M409DRAFT_29515 [Zasmidium cellare ATCC 36951]
MRWRLLIGSVSASFIAGLWTASKYQERKNGLIRAADSRATFANREEHGFAFVFYATNDLYACSVLVNIRKLQQLGSAYPVHVLVSSSRVGEDSLSAFASENVTVHLQDVLPLRDGIFYYEDCLVKLHAFKMHILSPGLRRVLILDADQLIMQNLDHLFHGIPVTDLAAPRAYWISKDYISSTLMLIAPSDRLWSSIRDAMDSIGPDTYDMDLINSVFGETVTMLSGEYATLNSHWDDWNLPSWYHPISARLGAVAGAPTNTSPADRRGMEGELSGLRGAAAVVYFSAVGKREL